MSGKGIESNRLKIVVDEICCLKRSLVTSVIDALPATKTMVTILSEEIWNVHSSILTWTVEEARVRE